MDKLEREKMFFPSYAPETCEEFDRAKKVSRTSKLIRNSIFIGQKREEFTYCRQKILNNILLRQWNRQG